MFTDFYMQLLVHVRVSTVIDLGAEKLSRNKVLFHGILNNFCVASTCTVHLFIKLFLACHLICNIKLPLFLKNFERAVVWKITLGMSQCRGGEACMSQWSQELARWGLGPCYIQPCPIGRNWRGWTQCCPRPSRMGLSMGPIIPDPPHRNRSWSWKPGTFSFLVSWPYSCISAALWWPGVECNIDIHCS